MRKLAGVAVLTLFSWATYAQSPFMAPTQPLPTARTGHVNTNVGNMVLDAQTGQLTPGHADFAYDLVHQGGQGQGHPLQGQVSRLHPGELEQLVNEGGQPVRLLQHDLEGLPVGRLHPVQYVLEVGAQRRRRVQSTIGCSKPKSSFGGQNRSDRFRRVESSPACFR